LSQICPTAHALSHRPQCIASVAAFVSHPFTVFPSQLNRAKTQSFVHCDPLQVVPGHTWPHIPQFCGDEVRSMHIPLHAERPGGQLDTSTTTSIELSRASAVASEPPSPPSVKRA
jgi:hypothetical protein